MKINVSHIEVTPSSERCVKVLFQPQNLEVRFIDEELDELHDCIRQDFHEWDSRIWTTPYTLEIGFTGPERDTKKAIQIFVPMHVVLAMCDLCMTKQEAVILDEQDMKFLRKEYWPRPNIMFRPVVVKKDGKYDDIPLLSLVKPHMKELSTWMAYPCRIANNCSHGGNDNADVMFALEDFSQDAIDGSKPPSLYFHVTKKGKHVINGGIIWHNDHYSIHT